MRFEKALKAMREGKKVRRAFWDSWEAMWIKDNKFYCYDNMGKDVWEYEEWYLDNMLAEDWEIVDEQYNNYKDHNPFEVIRIKDNPIFEANIKEWERVQNISKIHYNVGDNCVFEITRGNKKWTIPLDKFFDKVIEIAGEPNE